MAMIKFNMAAAVIPQIILGELLILCKSCLHDCVPSTYGLCLHMHICFQHGCMHVWPETSIIIISYWHVCTCIHPQLLLLLHKKGSILDLICTIELLIYKEQ